jgi:RsiW-degrading membrane proteinase PrsW (M82 family)
MNGRRFNWPLWVGVLLTLFAAFSYPFIFIWNPVTRDFTWVNLLLFAVAIVFLFLGIRRGFGRDRAHPTRSKIFTSLAGGLSVLIIALFLFSYFVFARWLPPSTGAPQVGQKVPEFTLPDSTGRQVSLNELLTTPIEGKAPKGVLLIFYRGYW